MASTDWERVYEEWGDALILYARQFIPARHEAEDVVQDAFVKLFGKNKASDHPNMKALLFQSVRWTALDRLKKNSRRESREELACSDLFQTGKSPEASPLEADEFSALISRLLSRLPDEQREVLVLHLWDDMSFREIGEHLGISPNTAASRYRYGLAQLRSESESLQKALPEQRSALTLD